jgi:hypothetical protein
MSRTPARSPSVASSEPPHPALAALSKLSEGPSEELPPWDEREIDAGWGEVDVGELAPEFGLVPLAEVRTRWLSKP